MEANSVRRTRRGAIELWRIVILVAGAFFFAIFAFGRVPSGATHEDILTSLRAVDVNHASLQRDVLLARAGLLKDFDSLAMPVKKLHVTVSRLHRLFSESDVETSSAITDELSALASSIDRDEKLVEEFKTMNALLQNSLVLANQTLSKLNETAPLALSKAPDFPVVIGNLLMRFVLHPTDALGKNVKTQLHQMRRSHYGLEPDVKFFAVHAEIILDMLPEVDRVIAGIQASLTSEEARLLQKVYLPTTGRRIPRFRHSALLQRRPGKFKSRHYRLSYCPSPFFRREPTRVRNPRQQKRSNGSDIRRKRRQQLQILV